MTKNRLRSEFSSLSSRDRGRHRHRTKGDHCKPTVAGTLDRTVTSGSVDMGRRGHIHIFTLSLSLRHGMQNLFCQQPFCSQHGPCPGSWVIPASFSMETEEARWKEQKEGATCLPGCQRIPLCLSITVTVTDSPAVHISDKEGAMGAWHHL